jgi:UDP-N-acetylmuramate--alanine ligase
MTWTDRGLFDRPDTATSVGPFRLARKIHFVAIGGIGMSGIAEVLLHLGFEVSGSDMSAGPATERLQELGARVVIGHDPTNVGDADVVVYSSAVPSHNPELQVARDRAIPIIRRAEMLAELMRLKHGIAIAGSHGKTTTTSLVATVLGEGGLDPTVIVGGRLLALGGTAILGQGQYLVAEADESDGTFLRLSPTLAVVTNVDREHLDHYKDMDAVRGAFVDFMDRIPFYGQVFACIDDAELARLLPRLRWPARTYGSSDEADVQLRVVGRDSRGQKLEFSAGGSVLGPCHLPLFGLHNARNAAAAVSVGLELDLPYSRIAEALESFAGVGRRLEFKGDVGGVTVVDDYGHHPTEVDVTLKALREAHPDRRLVVIFQPHRFTRTRDHYTEFAEVLAQADVVGILPIYQASEKPIVGVSSELIVDRLREEHGVSTRLLSSLSDACQWARSAAMPGDTWITQGAGDVGRLADPLLQTLKDRIREDLDEEGGTTT